MLNGGDNIAVYVPVLARLPTDELAGYIVVFLTLVGVWCLVGRTLTGHRVVASWIERWGHIIYPCALIAIGVIILISGGAFGL